jgi:hypothetical protein
MSWAKLPVSCDVLNRFVWRRLFISDKIARHRFGIIFRSTTSSDRTSIGLILDDQASEGLVGNLRLTRCLTQHHLKVYNAAGRQIKATRKFRRRLHRRNSSEERMKVSAFTRAYFINNAVDDIRGITAALA